MDGWCCPPRALPWAEHSQAFGLGVVPRRSLPEVQSQAVGRTAHTDCPAGWLNPLPRGRGSSLLRGERVVEGERLFAEPVGDVVQRLLERFLELERVLNQEVGVGHAIAIGIPLAVEIGQVVAVAVDDSDDDDRLLD